MPRNRYYLSVNDLAHARGSDARFAWQGIGPDSVAAALLQALRSDALFQRWRAAQPDPDAVDASLGAIDPAAEASASVADLHTDLVLTTNLPMRVVRQRLSLLIGTAWTLRDMRAA
jgi:hypothetical protein